MGCEDNRHGFRIGHDASDSLNGTQGFAIDRKATPRSYAAAFRPFQAGIPDLLVGFAGIGHDKGFDTAIGAIRKEVAIAHGIDIHAGLGIVASVGNRHVSMIGISVPCQSNVLSADLVFSISQPFPSLPLAPGGGPVRAIVQVQISGIDSAEWA